MYKDRTDLYAGGVLQKKLFSHLSKAKKSAGNSSYPKETMTDEVVAHNKNAIHNVNLKLGDQIRHLKDKSVETSNAVNISSKGFDVTYIFLQNANASETISGFKIYDV